MAAKILLMSDLHITDAGDIISGLDPLDRLRAAVGNAAATHADAQHLVLMGDLVHNGQVSQYQRLHALLQDLPWPITMMLGNHDRRVPFHTVFGGDPDRFVQTKLQFGDTALFCLDSLDEAAPDTHSGYLCADRMQWLSDALTDHDGPSIVLIHHHLMPTGFDGMDAIALRNATELAQLLSRHANCQMVVNGHIHRIISGTFHGVPQTMIKSPCHQMPMILGVADSSLSVAEPGGYGMILLRDTGAVVHHIDVDLPPAPTTYDAAS